MASPQTEEGYTKIANELLEALASIRIPGEAMQVLFVIIRKTYGFNKPSDLISLSQFVSATGIKRPSVVRAIKKLLEMRVIKKSYKQYQKCYPSSKNATPVAKRLPATGGSYELNKDYEQWHPSSKNATPVAKTLMTPVAKALHTKETITKEINTPCAEKNSAPDQNKPAVKINGWGIWVDINREQKRADPIPTGADTKAAKMLVEHIKDLQTIKDVMRFFLDDDDPFLQRNGHALRHISGRVNAYVNAAESMFNVPDDEEAIKKLIEIENEVAAEEKAKRESGNTQRSPGVN